MIQAEQDEAVKRERDGRQQAKLALMANQIGDFFKSYPEAEAVAGIAAHINKFWSRRMREDLRTGFAADASALSPLVRQALARIRTADGG